MRTDSARAQNCKKWDKEVPGNYRGITTVAGP